MICWTEKKVKCLLPDCRRKVPRCFTLMPPHLINNGALFPQTMSQNKLFPPL